jgi:hypothetical protein
MTCRFWVTGVRPAAGVIAVLIAGLTLSAAELRPRTIAAWDQYVQRTEARMDADLSRGTFLAIDAASEPARRDAHVKLRRGEILISRQQTRDGGRALGAPGGLIHHWQGVVFLPKIRLAAALAMAQDYNRYTAVFGEVVKRSQLVSREDNVFKVRFRFMLKKIFTGVVNVDSDVVYVPVDASREYLRAHSSRVAEVENADTSRERELPVGRDNGYLWRVNSYWWMQEKDGGTYLQCEWLSLSRDIPFGLGWLIEPIVTGLSRETLRLTLQSAQRLLVPAGATPSPAG